MNFTGAKGAVTNFNFGGELRTSGLRTAVLSACQTGMPGTWLLDEMVSLPTALTQAGVAGVVASLWLVDDASTMMLMFRFYELWRQEHLRPAESLRRAQVWFRTTDDAQQRAYFKGFIPRYGGSGVAAKAAEAAYKYLMVRNPIAHSNPYYWAAFGYTGL
jgi:CHAT domain-containing protein